MELVVSEFSGELQNKILEKMNNEYLATGRYAKDQMSVSPKIMSSLITTSSAAGTALSAMTSDRLFIATASKTNLIQYGDGSWSSMIKNTVTGKIADHAGFLPVASSLPIVAPMMAMQALSTVAVLQQLGSMDRKLDVIKQAIDKILARQEATKLAELFTTVQMVDELYSQYKHSGYFSTDMLIRLALAERDAAILYRRYEMLENAEPLKDGDSDFYNYDTYCTTLASFLNLRVKHLRTNVDIQENPECIRQSEISFKTLLRDTVALWNRLLHKSDKMKNDIEGIAAQIEGAKGFQKLTQMAKEKELSRLKEEYTATMEKERIILQDFHSLIDTSKQLLADMDSQVPPTLIYWRDQEGEHCITTNEPIFEHVNATASLMRKDD